MNVTKYCLGFVFVAHASHVLLIQKNKPGHWQHGRLNGLGGRIEPGETALDAMLRETNEEAGIQLFDPFHPFRQNSEGYKLRAEMVFPGAHVSVFSMHVDLEHDQLPLLIGSPEGHVSFFHCRNAIIERLGVPNLCWLLPLMADRERRLRHAVIHFST